jgi:20S proteasome alpha/beta subunit
MDIIREILVNKSSLYSTIAGVVCKDGIILGTEKIIANKMQVSGTDKRIYSVTKNAGSVSQLTFLC